MCITSINRHIRKPGVRSTTGWSNVFRLAVPGVGSQCRCVCSVSLFSREIGTFRRGEAIAIFIDTIWPSTVKPGPFPVRNRPTDFDRQPGHVLPSFSSLLCLFPSCNIFYPHAHLSAIFFHLLPCPSSPSIYTASQKYFSNYHWKLLRLLYSTRCIKHLKISLTP